MGAGDCASTSLIAKYICLYKKISNWLMRLSLVLRIYAGLCQWIGKIYFTGELNSDELNSLYEIADIGIHPSLNEQCSFSVLEMMKYGLPIIGYDLSGMSCLINHNLNGTKISLKKNIKI